MKITIINKYSISTADKLFLFFTIIISLFFSFFIGIKTVKADIAFNGFLIDDDEQAYQISGTPNISQLITVPTDMTNPSLICYISDREDFNKNITSVQFGGDELTEIWSEYDARHYYHYFWWIKNPKQGSYHLTFTKEDEGVVYINCRAIQGVGGIGNILTQGNFTGTQTSPYEHTYQTGDFSTDSLLLAWGIFQNEPTSTQGKFFSLLKLLIGNRVETIYQTVGNNNNRVTWTWSGNNYYGTSKIIELTKEGTVPNVPDNFQYSFPIDREFSDLENNIIYDNNEDILIFENQDFENFNIHAGFTYPENYLDYSGGIINMIIRDKERNFIRALPTTKIINSNNLPFNSDGFIISKNTGFEMNTCQYIEIIVQYDKQVINQENIIICLYDGEMPDSDKFFLNQSEIDQNFPFQKTYNKLSNKIIFGTFIKLEQNVKDLFNQLKNTSRTKNSNMKLYFEGQEVDLLEIKDNSTKGIYDFIYNISTIVFYSLFIVYIIFRARTFINND